VCLSVGYTTHLVHMHPPHSRNLYIGLRDSMARARVRMYTRDNVCVRVHACVCAWRVRGPCVQLGSLSRVVHLQPVCAIASVRVCLTRLETESRDHARGGSAGIFVQTTARHGIVTLLAWKGGGMVGFASDELTSVTHV
jgi:hypothetical protein